MGSVKLTVMMNVCFAFWHFFIFCHKTFIEFIHTPLLSFRKTSPSRQKEREAAIVLFKAIEKSYSDQ
jgi:hypothetical protein